MSATTSLIPALEPDGAGHQFVCYADSCSGIRNGSNEQNFAAINKIISSLQPAPEFICFPGDEIKGLQSDPIKLQKQWRYWLDTEMAWLTPMGVPIYHTTGNHTAYDQTSNAVFREALAHLPQNGPIGQEGLTYFVRKNDLLMVFVNTLNEALGGEGWVESEWLDGTLQAHADAKHKLVFGHHPVHAVNGFSGPHQRTVERESGRCLWNVLVKHQVMAYVCSHILAFDVQVHQGVLQILTGGAGTMPLSPESEYFHCVQAALDANGLRYQVLDIHGKIREWLKWPLWLPPSAEWQLFTGKAPIKNRLSDHTRLSAHFTIFEISGNCSPDQNGTPQTFLSADHNGAALSSIWIGLRGKQNQLCMLIIPEPGRSPRFWLGPQLKAGERFNIQVGLHSGMGPGGLLWRWDDDSPWSSLKGTTAWGIEEIEWPTQWHIGKDQYGENNRPFCGSDLKINYSDQAQKLDIG